jgi:hypothetical protein
MVARAFDSDRKGWKQRRQEKMARNRVGPAVL